jgi:hypothetical protein
LESGSTPAPEKNNSKPPTESKSDGSNKSISEDYQLQEALNLLKGIAIFKVQSG